jgi:hypothetical protein
MSHSSFSWPAFGVFLALGLAALILSLPFPPKLSLLVPGIAVMAGAVGAGLWLAKGIGLRVSAVEGWLRSAGDWLQLLRLMAQPALAGAGLGIVILLAIRYLFVPVLPPLQSRFTSEAAMAVWKRVVIAFDAAVLEEILFRLCLFSLLAWMLGRFWQAPDGLPARGALWAVNLFIAMGFGLAHLPRWASLTPLTPLVVVTVVLLNGVGGFIFGWLYFAQGLEAAMLAHLTADVVLHVFGPGFLKS